MTFQPISRREVIKTAVAGVVLSRPLSAMAQGESTLPAVMKAIPSTGEKLPVIGLGTNAYGAKNDEEKKPLREVLEQMSQLGGKLIDTAQAYGLSEQTIGELLRSLGNRDKYFVATKTQIKGDYSNPQAIVDLSFKALRMEKIDLLQIHSLGGLQELMPLLEKSKASGRIRYIGMSTSADDQYDKFMDAMRKYPFDLIQVDYSIENQNAERVLDLALERRQGVIINVPFGGRKQAATTFQKVADRQLPDWAAEFDAKSWAQFFLKYVISHPAVTVAIPGTTKLKHLQDNQGAGRGRLPDAAMRKKMEQYWATLG